MTEFDSSSRFSGKADKQYAFVIPHYQYLDKEGKPTQSLPNFAQDKAEMLRIYRALQWIRHFDQKAINLQRTGKMGTYPSVLGQEAISVGIGHAMQKDDVLVPYYRDIGAQYLRGLPMENILRYWGGDERGMAFAGLSESEDFPLSVPIASQCLHAVGIAKAFQYRKQKRAVVVTIGDGGTSQGDFYEALNLAGTWQAPVVFVINNNRWAISVPLSLQTHCQTLAQKGVAAGIPGIQVDGNDVVAVKQLMQEALHQAREGQGPVLIEALSYRLGDHTTADDASRYRPAGELEQAWIEEPVKRVQSYLSHQQWWDDNQEQALQAQIQEEVTAIVDSYLTTAAQSASAMFDHLYATLPDDLKIQREQALRFEGVSL